MYDCDIQCNAGRSGCTCAVLSTCCLSDNHRHPFSQMFSLQRKISTIWLLKYTLSSDVAEKHRVLLFIHKGVYLNHICK